jgi:PEP-CTERM motif
MRMKKMFSKAAMIAVALGCVANASSASATTYVLSQLTAPGRSGFAFISLTGINESGQISGFGRRGDGTTQSLFWDSGQSEARVIQQLSGLNSVTAGINESGVIVGTRSSASGFNAAFTYDIASNQLNEILSGVTVGNGINDSGFVVGSQTLLGLNSGPVTSGFVYDPSVGSPTFYALPTNAKSAEFNAITNDGHIIGSRTPPDPAFPDPAFDPQHSVFVLENQSGSIPDGPFSQFRREDFVAANNAGQYAVNFTFPGAPFFINFVGLANLDGTSNPAGLGRLPGDDANYGGGFNDQLDFVGESYDENRYGGSYGDAIITTVGGGTLKLADLVTNLNGNFLQQGKLINNHGQILAFGFDSNGARASFLLTPDTYIQPGVPEPASWALMIAGFGLVGGSMRRRAKAGGQSVAA